MQIILSYLRYSFTCQSIMEVAGTVYSHHYHQRCHAKDKRKPLWFPDMYVCITSLAGPYFRPLVVLSDQGLQSLIFNQLFQIGHKVGT